ncbi:PREDICTED: non-specific lipid-transfer protein 1-like [Ipomoea nil]|uniref:non-specific lipid-transfer protein 1-like n=1 Tax=Ipomoea nil TaxID=35883 RepID=UPI000900D0B8|nr:PREDICTED: non-specific lipid-transfer protein 1-like [Ipomoea nil]
MAHSVNLSLAWLLLTSIAALLAPTPPSVVAEITCSTVFNALIPCYKYVVGGGLDVPTPCCGGLKNLLSWDYGREDVQKACACLKTVFHGVGEEQISRAMDIPGKCGVNLGFQFGGDMNCDNIQ